MIGSKDGLTTRYLRLIDGMIFFFFLFRCSTVPRNFTISQQALALVRKRMRTVKHTPAQITPGFTTVTLLGLFFFPLKLYTLDHPPNRKVE